jgi:hypothetical protein
MRRSFIFSKASNRQLNKQGPIERGAIDYVKTVERRLHELDVLGLEGEAKRLQHQLGLGPLEYAPRRRQRLRDARSSRRVLGFLLRPFDAICQQPGTREAAQLPYQQQRDPNARAGRRREEEDTYRGMTGWIAGARRTCRGWLRTP